MNFIGNCKNNMEDTYGDQKQNPMNKIFIRELNFL